MTERSNRFSDTNHLLPSFRRPNYRIVNSQKKQKKSSKAYILRKWTEETGQFYRTINSSLLNDEYALLSKQGNFIKNLQDVIKGNLSEKKMKVYRGLNIGWTQASEYKVGQQFLWPNFTSTTKDRNIAQRFGQYLFVIETNGEGITYYSDISQDSIYPLEKEVLFYPYSGFKVTYIDWKSQIIYLTCVDTLLVENTAEECVPMHVRLYDSSRRLYVRIDKGDTNLYTKKSRKSRWEIEQSGGGYWDSPTRFHHPNGYITRAKGQWEEYQNGKKFASFFNI